MTDTQQAADVPNHDAAIEAARGIFDGQPFQPSHDDMKRAIAVFLGAWIPSQHAQWIITDPDFSDDAKLELAAKATADELVRP